MEHNQDQITSHSLNCCHPVQAAWLSHLDHCNSCLSGFSTRLFTSPQVSLHTTHKNDSVERYSLPVPLSPFQPCICLGPEECQSPPSCPSPHGGQQLLVTWAQGLGGPLLPLSSLRLRLSLWSWWWGLVMLSSCLWQLNSTLVLGETSPVVGDLMWPCRQTFLSLL